MLTALEGTEVHPRIAIIAGMRADKEAPRLLLVEFASGVRQTRWCGCGLIL